MQSTRHRQEELNSLNLLTFQCHHRQARGSPPDRAGAFFGKPTACCEVACAAPCSDADSFAVSACPAIVQLAVSRTPKGALVRAQPRPVCAVRGTRLALARLRDDGDPASGRPGSPHLNPVRNRTGGRNRCATESAAPSSGWRLCSLPHRPSRRTSSTRATRHGCSRAPRSCCS